MALTLITPSAPLVSLAEAKRHVRTMDFDDDDDYLTSLIAVAQAHVDGPSGWLGRSFGEQSWRLSLNAFPTGGIKLPAPPLISVEAMEYTDVNGATQTITDFRAYGVADTRGCGYLLPVYGGAWPVARDQPEAVRIEFTAGMASIPPQLKHGMLLLIGEWYENREDAGAIKLNEIPTCATALLMPLRFWPS